MSSKVRPHFGTDGIRGNADKELIDDFVFALGKAIATAIFDHITTNKLDEDAEIVIGRDTRSSGSRIEKALANGLMAAGAKVASIGILPTPAISLYAEKQNVYACAITASHNPAIDNGIKVFLRGGQKTDENFEAKIESYLNTYLDSDLVVEIEFVQDVEDKNDKAFKTYITWLQESFNELSLDGLAVALDCANGASYETAPSIFNILGAKTLPINVESDGIHINENCGATDLSSLKKYVLSNQVDIAFAFDGDADRIMILDENAKEYDGDYILALLAKELDLDPKIIVATSMSNGALKTFLSRVDTQFVETAVGDKNVALGMRESGAKIGGEQSGHIIYTDYASFGDGVLIAILISGILAARKNVDQNVKASELLNLFTPMVQLHEKVEVVNKKSAIQSDDIDQAIREHLSKLGVDSRIVIRPSGTEDIVRIMVEADQKSLAEKSMTELIDIVKASCKE